MRLAVVADDAGFAPASDDAILRAAQDGVVTCASVAVNGPTAAAFARAALLTDLSLGLHLNLTDGAPVSEACSDLGRVCFSGDKRGVWTALSHGAVALDEVQAEVRAQFLTLADLLGRAPAFVNGHNHVHVLPDVCESVTAAVAELAPGAWVRVPAGFTPEEFDALFAEGCARAAAAPGAAFAGHAFARDPSLAAFLAEVDAARDAGAETLEFMVHPGARPATGFTSSDARDRETAVLCDPALAAALDERGVELTPL